MDDVLDPIASDQRETLAARTVDQTIIHRTLGLSWRISNDKFVFKGTSDPNRQQWTKRTVLSFIARLFDSLGWIAPVVGVAKIEFQQLWTEHLECDDPLPTDAELKWNQLNE